MTTAYQSALKADREGRPFRDHLIENARDTLFHYQRLDPETKVTISTAGPGKACAVCEAQAGKVFSLEEALHLMPLPCPTCEFALVSMRPGFCRCLWLPVVEERPR